MLYYSTCFFNELLFRHIFETQIHIQTQNRKTFIWALAIYDFLVIKVSQRIANDKIIEGKTILQKSVILPIILGVSPT